MPEHAIAILLILLAVLRILGNHLRLRSIPGPWFTGISSFWQWQVQGSPSFSRRLCELHQNHGKVVRLGPSCVSVSDETLLRPCRHNGQLDRASFKDSGLDIQESQGRNALPESIGEYLGDANVDEGTIDRLVANFIATIKPHHVEDFPALLCYLGKEFVDILTMDDPVASDATGSTTLARHDYPGAQIRRLLSPSTTPCLPMSNLKAKSRRGYCPLRRSMKSECYSTGTEQTMSPRSSFTISKDSSNYKLKSIVATFVSTFHFLSKYPSIMSTLKQELERAFHEGDLSDIPGWTELNTLSYLDAVMKESMRLCPSNTYHHEAESPPGGMAILGYFIPEKTTIVCHSEVVRRSHNIYGSHTDSFDPERWMAVDDQQHAVMAQNLFPCGIPFYDSLKPYAAWLELKKATVLILRDLDTCTSSATV